MNHPTFRPPAHASQNGIFSPMQIEMLARAVLQRERLSWRELPRCRREIRLQLLLSGGSLQSARPRPPASNAMWRPRPLVAA